MDPARQLIIPREGRPTVRQVFCEKTLHILPPEASYGMIMVSGALAFPVVEILEKIGPFEMGAMHDYNHPAKIVTTFQRELDLKARQEPRVNHMNGIILFDADRLGIHQNVRGNRVSREIETAKYFLARYAPTGRVSLRNLDMGELLEA
jgi:hypothetical protein